MENGLKLLLIAASAIIVCVVCVIGFSITKEGKNNVNHTTEQFTSLTSDYGEVELSVYHNMTISGTELVDLILSKRDEIVTDETLSIVVVTNANKGSTNSSATVYNKLNYANIYENTKESNSNTVNYINPNGKFLGSVERTPNGMITSIIFTQS